MTHCWLAVFYQICSKYLKSFFLLHLISSNRITVFKFCHTLRLLINFWFLLETSFDYTQLICSLLLSFYHFSIEMFLRLCYLWNPWLCRLLRGWCSIWLWRLYPLCYFLNIQANLLALSLWNLSSNFHAISKGHLNRFHILLPCYRWFLWHRIELLVLFDIQYWCCYIWIWCL